MLDPGLSALPAPLNVLFFLFNWGAFSLELRALCAMRYALCPMPFPHLLSVQIISSVLIIFIGNADPNFRIRA
jgi:hypothetical protein